MLALCALADGPLRFNALARRVEGVSQKMLTQSLQALERDGFVLREMQSTFPMRVEYSLTVLGRDTAARALDLIGLLTSRMPEILESQSRHDSAAAISDAAGD